MGGDGGVGLNDRLAWGQAEGCAENAVGGDGGFPRRYGPCAVWVRASEGRKTSRENQPRKPLPHCHGLADKCPPLRQACPRCALLPRCPAAAGPAVPSCSPCGTCSRRSTAQQAQRQALVQLMRQCATRARGSRLHDRPPPVAKPPRPICRLKLRSGPTAMQAIPSREPCPARAAQHAPPQRRSQVVARQDHDVAHAAVLDVLKQPRVLAHCGQGGCAASGIVQAGRGWGNWNSAGREEQGSS